MSSQSAVAVLCWSGICRLGSIQIGSLGLINTLPFDHESGSPESLLGLRPDINKPPVGRGKVLSLSLSDRGLPPASKHAASSAFRGPTSFHHSAITPSSEHYPASLSLAMQSISTKNPRREAPTVVRAGGSCRKNSP